MAKKKFILNPNKEIVKEIRKGIKLRGGHCPCQIEDIPENICPCVDFREEQICHCNLFIEDNSVED